MAAQQPGGGLAHDKHEPARDNGGAARPAAQAPIDRSTSEGEVHSGHRPAAKKLRSGGLDAVALPPVGLAPVRCAALPHGAPF